MWEVNLWEKVFVKNERKIYQSYVSSAMLYGSETWCLRENKMAILRRTEKAIMRAICGVEIIDKRRSQELVSLLGLKDTLDGLARASEVRWYGHVLRRALDFKVARRRGHEPPNMM